ncbi:MAG: hypothetical protein R3F43_11610 [bacterium]
MNKAPDLDNEEAEVIRLRQPGEAVTVALAFKLEDAATRQLQPPAPIMGTMRKGEFI